jgi:hypothetical protein
MPGFKEGAAEESAGERPSSIASNSSTPSFAHPDPA